MLILLFIILILFIKFNLYNTIRIRIFNNFYYYILLFIFIILY